MPASPRAHADEDLGPLGAQHAGAPPGPEAGEKEQLAFFLALGERDAGALAELAPAVLRGDDPDCRKVALLRALHEKAWPEAADAFTLALVELPDRSRPQAVSVPEFAVDFLGERSAGDPVARGILRAAGLGARPASSRALRARAATHFARSANPSELRELASLLATQDASLRAAVAAGLASNPEQRTVELLFADLPVLRGPRTEEGDPPFESP